jgi:copper chaperone CopZ
MYPCTMVEYVTKSFLCPDIRSQSDAEIIRETLENAPEIDSCEIDVPARTVTVRFAESLNEFALAEHLRDAGFPPETE